MIDPDLTPDDYMHTFHLPLWMDRITRLVRSTHEMVGGNPSHHWVLTNPHPIFGEVITFGRESGQTIGLQ